MFETFSLPLLIGIFVGSAIAVWLGGTKLAGYVDAFSTKMGIGQAFAGMLLLGGITSLPELAAVSTSAAIGNAGIAVNNLLGTASINLVLLACADIVFGREALTAVAARPVTLMQGMLSILLATMVGLIVVAGDIGVGRVGAGAMMVGLLSIGAVWIVAGYQHRHVWEVIDAGSDESENGEAATEETRSTGRLGLLIGLCAVLILVAGFLLSATADAIAAQTGLSTGLVGFILVGFATSLPELSSILAAVRLRRYQLAIGDIFGTNIFNVALIAVADVIYAPGPVLGEAGPFEAIGAILAALMTGIFLVGLLERRDRTILRMGYDSAAALIAFAGGLVLLARAA